MEYLIRHRERVVSKDDLLSATWGGRIVSESLNARMNAVRRAIGDSGDETPPLQLLQAPAGYGMSRG